MKLTDAMRRALKLAAVEPIRYYRGGWYTTPAIGGPDQDRPRLSFAVPAVKPETIRALVTRELLFHGGVGVYASRWTITDAGRAALAGEGQ